MSIHSGFICSGFICKQTLQLTPQVRGTGKVSTVLRGKGIEVIAAQAAFANDRRRLCGGFIQRIAHNLDLPEKGMGQP